jgi:hypothetical protein
MCGHGSERKALKPSAFTKASAYGPQGFAINNKRITGFKAPLCGYNLLCQDSRA